MTHKSETYSCIYAPQDKVVVSAAPHGALFHMKDGDTGEEQVVALSPEDARAVAKLILSACPEPRVEEPKKATGYTSLTPLAKKVYQHMQRAGSISAREAMNDYGITSASLARRICDIEEAGFKVKRERREHPLTGQNYTRYKLA